MFGNKVLRRIFGPKRDEVIQEWIKLHNEELYALYSSPNIIRVIKSRRMKWAGHVAHMGERRDAFRVLVGNPEGRRPLGRPERRWEVSPGDMDWIDLAQDMNRWLAVENAVMNLWVP